MSPADLSIMLTAMTQALKLTNSTFTNDQQLYHIAVNIMWVYTEQFVNFIPRLGGMHTLMSFVGAVGNWMADTVLESILEVAFGGATKMLSGKKYPQNVRALQLLIEELLQTVINNDTQSYLDLMSELQHRALSHTFKPWLDNPSNLC